MAKKETKSNKVPKLSDIIKSTVDNINEIADATRIIMGAVNNLADLIPDEFDKNIKKIQENLLKGVKGIDELVKVFANIDNNIKLDLKSLLSMRIKIKILEQYIYLFIHMFDNLADHVNRKGILKNDLYNSNNSIFSILKLMVDQIKLIDDFKLSTATIKILNIKFFIMGFKNLTEYLVKSLNSIYYDEFSKEYVSYIIENTKNMVDELISSISALDNISLVKLISNYKKIQLMHDNIQMLLNIQISLSDKINKKKLDGIKNRLIIIADITDNLNKIIDNLDNFNNKKINLNHLNKNIDAIINIVDSLEKLNEKLSKTNFKNIQVTSLLETINAIYKIEKQVILISLLSVPFAVASILFLVGVTTGMTAILLTIKLIMTLANPTLLRLARMSMRNLYKTILYIAFAITATILTIILITISALFIVEHIKIILLSIGVIGLVILAIAGLGWLIGLASTGIAMFSMGMVMLGVALVAIIGVTMILKLIANIEFSESEKIKENVNNILGTAKSVINSIFETFDSPLGTNQSDTDNNLLISLAKITGGDMFVNVIKMIMSCSILVFTIVSVGLVYLTAITLNSLRGDSITNMVDNKSTIIENVNEILGTAKSVINSIFETFDSPISEEGDGVLLWTAGQILGDSFINMFKLIISSVSLTFTIIAVAMVKITAWALKSINEINFNRETIRTNTNVIMGAARDVIASVNSPMDEISAPKKSISRRVVEAILPSSLVNMVDAIMAIGSLGPVVLAVGAVGFMAKQLNIIQSLSVDKNSIKTKSEEIISIGNNIVRLISNSGELKDVDISNVIKRANAIKLVSESINELGKDVNVDAHTKLTDNYVKFIDKIDKSKLENLKTARNLFKEMKEFSESINGNFEGLANALNEKIAPLLEELKGLIGKIPESVNKSASTISGSVYASSAIASGTANSTTLASQIQEENPSMSKEDVNRMVDQRMNEQAKTVNKGIEMKLEELVEILQNYSNPIPVRVS